MEKETKKTGLFGKLFGAGKTEKGSCCCGFKIEEIKEEKPDDQTGNNSSKTQKKSCCD